MVQRTIATAVDNWGRVDALVNNAGAGAIPKHHNAAL
jgi:NADP-dependent 3-hydroxy acid dehydrogenase YdfG